MRKLFFIPLCATYMLFMSAGMLTSCNSNAKDELAHHHHHHGGHDHEHEHEEGHDHDHDHDHEHDEHDGHEHHNHTGKEIELEPAIAKEFGVKTVTVKPEVFNSVVKVSGKIMESASGAAVASAPTMGTISFAPGISEGKQVKAGTVIATVRSSQLAGGDPNAAAKVALDAAKRELDRIRPLHEHGIVSTAEYNAALSEYEQAKVHYSVNAQSGRITAPISGTITQLQAKNGQFVEEGAPVASISTTANLTLRADLPQRMAGRTAEFTGAKVRTAYSPEVIDLADLNAHRVDGSGMVSSRPGYLPLYFSFINSGVMVPGVPVEVFLQGAPRQNVISVPVTALSEQQGKFFVYVKVDEECYLKKPITIGENDGTRVEVLSGISVGDVVVSEGVMTVRLAESSGVVPEGHTHNH